MNNKDSLILEELSHAGEASEITPELIELDGCRITSESNLPEEEFMMKLLGKKCFSRKDLTTITGPAKSGKTFYTSMLMASCVKKTGEDQKVLGLERIGEKPLKVMWYDTEQSKRQQRRYYRKGFSRWLMGIVTKKSLRLQISTSSSMYSTSEH